MVKIEITKSGVYGKNGPVPVGTVLDVPKEPTGWANKYRVVASDEGKTLEPATPERTTEEQEWLDAPAVGREVGSEQDDLEEARAEYEQAFGERPHPRMKAETIRARIAEAE